MVVMKTWNEMCAAPEWRNLYQLMMWKQRLNWHDTPLEPYAHVGGLLRYLWIKDHEADRYVNPVEFGDKENFIETKFY